MNILQINSVSGIGSTGRIARDLHATLLAQGRQSAIAFGRAGDRLGNPGMRVGSKLGSYLHVARTRLNDSHGFGSAAATKSLIRRMKALSPDVIHLHNLHGYYIHIGLLFDYLKVEDKPVIWTLHDCWAFTGHCAYFDSVGCERWKEQCHHCPATSEYPKSLMVDRSQRNFERKRVLFTGVRDLTIVTPSKWLAAQVSQSFLRHYPVEVIYNGVDLDIFQPRSSDFRRRYQLEDQYIILGVASPWTERKGYSYLLALAKRLRSDERIVLVGVSAKQMRQLPPGVIGIPNIDSAAKLAEIYSASDLFVNPTLEEVLGLVNLEALACGTPVVSFNTGGSPECLDASCGLVVDRGDMEGLVAAIETMRGRGKAAYAMQCRTRAQRYFDKDNRCRDYLTLYHKKVHLEEGHSSAERGTYQRIISGFTVQPNSGRQC